MSFHIYIFIYTIHFAYLKVYTKFENTGSNRSWEICDRNIHWREKKWTNKGTDKQNAAVFVTQYNLSLSSFVPNFWILSQVVDEKSLTEKNWQTDNIVTEKGTKLYTPYILRARGINISTSLGVELTNAA